VRILIWYLSSLTPHTAVVGTVRSLLCPGRHGRQRYTCSKNIHFGRGRNTLSIAMKLGVNVFYNVGKTYWAVCAAVPPWPAWLFTNPLEEIKLPDEHSTTCARGRNKSHLYITNCVEAIPLISDFMDLPLPEEKEETLCNRWRYSVNNTSVSNDVLLEDEYKTTCFGLIRPSSGFHPKGYQCI